MKFEKEALIKILDCCIKDDCLHCPNTYKDRRVTCGDFTRGHVNIPVCIMRETINALKEQEAEIKHLKRPDCEHAEHDGTGCLGYCGCTQDDEPIESCKRCEKYTGNVYEAVKWNV